MPLNRQARRKAEAIRRKSNRIEANAPPAEFRIVGAGGPLEIEAAAAGADGKPALRRFNMVAYNGGPMNLRGFYYPVVVDLQGVSVPSQNRPVLRDHDQTQIVGHTDAVKVTSSQIKAAGIVSGVGEAAQEILATSGNGFPWQCSIGAAPGRMEMVEAGAKVKVNGQTFQGPLQVARACTLGEISFVAIGADMTTSATVAAQHRGPAMNEFDKWLVANGWDVATVNANDGQKKILQAAFDATKDNKPPTPPIVGDPNTDRAAIQARQRQEDAAELDRVEGIKRICAKHGNPMMEIEVDGKKVNTLIASHAIRNGWDAERAGDKAKHEELLASRPNTPNISTPGSLQADEQAQVLEASLCIAGGISEAKVGKWFDQKVMNLSVSKLHRGARISTVMSEVCRSAGMHLRAGAINDDSIRTTLNAEKRILAQGFTTLSLSGVLGNTANKALIDGYTAVETTYAKFCAIRSHGDFKVHTRYRLDATGAFKKVGPTGEIEHIGLSEASHTNQLATFGAMIVLTRQMQINDDLGAFLALPTFLGRMSALRIEEGAYVLLLSNPSNFFGTGNRNLTSGGSSALSIASLGTVEAKFKKQVDSNGKPVLISPKVLLTGTVNGVTARDIFLWTQTNETTTADTKKPNGNQFQGRYDPVISPYLDNTAITDQDGTAISGQSSTLWFMFADPAVRAAIAVAFLNGQQMPTIESSDTEFQTLGMQWRAYHDFGFGMEDPVAAQMAAGV